MKLHLLLIAFLSLGIMSCGGDSEEPEGNIILNYDGDNFNAPTLAGGTYEFAIRFPAVTTDRVIGRELTEVSFYLYDIPDQVTVSLYPDATATTPGAAILSQPVTSLSANSWNTIILDEPYEIEVGGLWVAVEIVHSEDFLQTVGCDRGPALTNGDWLFSQADGDWLPFQERVNDSVNWNIRAIIN